MSQFRGLEPLTIDNLGEGTAAYNFNQAIREAIEDIVKRPSVKRARSITLTMELSPEPSLDDTGFVPTWVWKIQTTTPGVKGTQQYGMLENGVAMTAPKRKLEEQTEFRSIAEFDNYRKESKS